MNEKLHLDVDFEQARAVHRIVRALHDGECPQCHRLLESRLVIGENGDEGCGYCGFTIKYDEIQAAMRLFAPVMDRNLKIFEDWRKSLK